MEPAPGRELYLLAIGCFERRTLDHVVCFLTAMDVTRDEITGLVFGDRKDHLHIRPGYISALQFLSVLWI
jgi:hypothetical protein